MQAQRGFVGVGVLIAILVGLAVLGGGAYYVVHQQSPSQTTSNNFDNVQTLPTTNNNQTQQNQPTKPPQITPPAPSTSFLTIHGIYSLRAKPALEYLAFSLYAEGPNNPLGDVTQLFFNDEPGGRPGVHVAPSGSSFGPIAGDLRPRTSCDLEIDVTVEIKNPVFEARSGENIGNYRVVSGDFVRVVKRGQATDVCSVDNGHGGTTLERTPRAPDITNGTSFTHPSDGYTFAYDANKLEARASTATEFSSDSGLKPGCHKWRWIWAGSGDSDLPRHARRGAGSIYRFVS